MKNKEIRSLIKELVKQERSKQEIFDTLNKELSFKSDAIKHTATIPSPEDRKTFGLKNKILFGILIYFSILKFLNGAVVLGEISFYSTPVALIFPAITLLFAKIVWDFNGALYKIIGFLSIIGLLQQLSRTDFGSMSSFELGIEIGLSYLPGLIAIYLLFNIANNVFPYYRMFGSLKENELDFNVNSMVNK